MGAVWFMWVALLGQPQADGPGGPKLLPTATVAPAVEDPFADLPLSDEELALLEALDGPEAPAPPPPGPWGAPPDARGVRRVEGIRLAETAARSVEAARRALPLLGGRWRWGARSPVLFDGLLLSNPRLEETWIRADPWLVGTLALTLDADRAWTSEDLGGSIHLRSRRAQTDRPLFARAGAGLRSADRATGARLDVGGGGARWGARLFGAGYREGDPMIEDADGNRRPLEEAGWRGDAGASFVLAPIDGLTLRSDVALTAEEGQPRGLEALDADRRFGLLVSGAVEVGGSTLGVSLSGGYLLGRYGAVEPRDSGAQARLHARWRPLSTLSLEAGGFFGVDRTETASTAGSRRHVAGFAFATYARGRWYARAGLRVANLRTTTEGDPPREVTDVLPSADLLVLLLGDPEGAASAVGEGLALSLRGGRGLELAGPWDAARADAFGAERSWRVAGGPALRLPRLWVDARAVFARVDSARRAATVLGAELDGGATLLDGLHLAFAIAWLEGVEEDAPEGLATSDVLLANPNLRGHLALRYTMPARRTYVELRARASSPRLRARSQYDPGDRETAFGFVRLGLAGGLDLGAGFRLEATVENALDRRTRDLGTSASTPGVDLRATLSWATEP